MIRIIVTAILAFATACTSASAQSPGLRGGSVRGYEIIGSDTITVVQMSPVRVFSKPRDMRKYERLIKNVKKVYPISKEAREYMETLENELSRMNSARDREKFTQKMEKDIVRKYTPVLEKMTFSQGKILIKLIDRETNRTSYQILRDFRGRFTAGFYNSIARIFKANLKQGYNPDSDPEDAMIEQIIMMIEAGQI